MKSIVLYLLVITCLNAKVFAQSNTVQQNAAQAKDAPVDVTISDFKKNLLSHEIVVLEANLPKKNIRV